MNKGRFLKKWHQGKKFIFFLLISGQALLFSNCNKIEQAPRYAKLEVNLLHMVGESELLMNSLQYTNEAGNNYGVTDLKYYISNITLKAVSGNHYYNPGIYYVDIKQAHTLSILLDSIPPGKYSVLSFDLGIDSERNLTGFLPNTLNNINMSWPVSMGGGYHFLKFEGNFEEAASTYGFAFHLGKSLMRIHYDLQFNKEFKYWNETLQLKHDISEWFKNPVTYDFSIHEPYSMFSDSVMQVVKNNGADVFKL